ncbi:MAG: TonB-dependent receptor [Bacteroidales bacterium]|nr:TonB-dependent receptor [Bacteroidales bacterium]
MKTKSCMQLRTFLLTLFAIATLSLAAQTTTVTGHVTDNLGDDVIGASVIEKGQKAGVNTDIDGNFSIKVTSPKATLVISYVGTKTEEVALNGRTHIEVKLSDDTQALDEVVVVGYGTQRKSDITGSVASLSEEQMRKTIVTNADQMLQGKVAGVQVTQNSGAPGGATSVRIRGASSINNSNEPLYVIDGVPMSSGNNDIGGFDWMGGSNGQTTVNPLAAIAPSDIVSIDVLKDASACAIYGAAGANGVVLVTTRRGSAGHSSITYDGYVAWQTVAKKLDMMDLREYATYQKGLYDEGILNSSNFDTTYSDPSLLGNGTDWQDEIFRTAFMQSHQVSMTGGNDKTQYAMSAGYMDQEGIIIGSDFNRFNTRFNIDNQLFSFLKVGGSLAYTRTDETITRQDGSDGVIMQAITMQPSVPVRDYDGNWAGPETVNGSSTWNPVALALQTNNKLLRQRIMGNFYAEADFLKYFKFRAEYAFDASQNQNKAYIPRYQFGQVSNDINQMMHREDHSWYWMQKDYITYHQTFAKKHDVTMMVGFEASKSSWNGTSLIKKNFTTDDIFIMTEDGDFVSNSGWADSQSQASFFGRLNYAFDSRYLLTATLRADGSSKFGSNHKWGYFPSVALAWRANQEHFLQDLSWLNNLKVRLGYGQVGNSNISTYLYGSSMSTMVTPSGTAYYPSNLSNPDLKWESSVQWNAGIDFAVLNNRIELTLDVYRKDTKDLLMQVQIPPQYGTNEWGSIQSPWANVGKTRNEGIDIQLNLRPIVTKDFFWQSAITMSHNKNKVIAMNEPDAVIYNGADWYSNFQTTSMIAQGYALGVFYGYETAGLFENEADIVGWATQTGSSTPYNNKIDKVNGAWVGDVKFVDQNGDGVIDESDQVIIGDPNPDLTWGWTNTFTYKWFELNIGLIGQFGGDIFNFSRWRTEGLSSIWDNQAKRVLNRAEIGYYDSTGSKDDISNCYLLPGHNGIPRFSNLDINGNNRMSDRWIEDGDYLRIQNISLAFNLPNKWLKAAHMQNAKIYFNVQNVYTWTKYKGYDPEIGAFNQSAGKQNYDMGRYPTPRTYTLGLNLSF